MLWGYWWGQYPGKHKLSYPIGTWGCWFRTSWYPVWTLLWSQVVRHHIPLLLAFLYITALYHTLDWKAQQKVSQRVWTIFTPGHTRDQCPKHTHTKQHSPNLCIYQSPARQLWSPSLQYKNHTCTDTNGKVATSDANIVYRVGSLLLTRVALARIKLQRGLSSNWLTVMIKPLWRHNKGLSPLPALIASLMKSLHNVPDRP